MSKNTGNNYWSKSKQRNKNKREKIIKRNTKESQMKSHSLKNKTKK